MSWQDRDKLDIKVTTGDGQEYTFLWMIASQKVKWHGDSKSYIQLPNSNVEKKKRQGRVFPLELYFTGDDHLEKSAAFITSLDDENPVTIQHPYYNTLICQILEVDQDNSQLNISKLTCTAIETMVGYVTIVQNPKDVILLQKIELDDLLGQQPEIVPTVQEVAVLKDTTKRVQKLGGKIISVGDQAQEYYNSFAIVNGYIDTFLQNPITAIQSINSFLSLPAQFLTSVTDRVQILKEQFDILRTTLFGINSVGGKHLYEAQQITLLSAMAQAAVLPFQNDYQNANTAVTVTKTISDSYDIYLEDLDFLQSANNSSPQSFIPSFAMSIKLQQIMNETISALYDFALSGRRQRVYVLPEDSCVILLTHKLMRLDPADKNIDEFIKNNNLTHRQIALGIDKGTTVTYFI